MSGSSNNLALLPRCSRIRLPSFSSFFPCTIQNNMVLGMMPYFTTARAQTNSLLTTRNLGTYLRLDIATSLQNFYKSNTYALFYSKSREPYLTSTTLAHAQVTSPAGPNPARYANTCQHASCQGIQSISSLTHNDTPTSLTRNDTTSR